MDISFQQEFTQELMTLPYFQQSNFANCPSRAFRRINYLISKKEKKIQSVFHFGRQQSVHFRLKIRYQMDYTKFLSPHMNLLVSEQIRQLNKIINKQINKFIIIFTTGMQNNKRNSQKLSHSSVKLPYLKPQSIQRGPSKNKMKMHDDSLEVLNHKVRNSYSRSLVKGKPSRYEKQKSRSRAEPIRFKTQGIINETYDSPSHDNSIEAPQLDNTMRNFQKNVQESRQQIQNEAKRKKLGNKSSLTSIKTAQQSIIQNKRSRILKKNTQKSEQSELFSKIIKIMSKSKTAACEVNLQQVQKTLQHMNIIKKFQKFKSQNGLQNIESNIISQFKSNRKNQLLHLKNQNNYTKWRRVIIDANQNDIQYEESTYQNENQRLNNLILKTQASLSKYWQNKKQYFQLLQKNEKSTL